MTQVQSLALVLALTLAVVTSSAVLPVVPLNQMAPEHACYFMCEICLQGAPEAELMECVTQVCGRIPTGATCGPVLDVGMLWLGHRCRHFQQLMLSMGAPEPEKKH
ncbi:hypothetical protein ACOMHN_025723 [Nucella lapillus]